MRLGSIRFERRPGGPGAIPRRRAVTPGALPAWRRRILPSAVIAVVNVALLVAPAPLVDADDPVLIIGVSPAAAMVTHTNLSACDVGVASTLCVAAPTGMRRLLELHNDSDTIIYCSTDGTAAALNKGRRLNPGGGVSYEDVAVPNAAIYCIHGSVGTKKLLPTVGE